MLDWSLAKNVSLANLRRFTHPLLNVRAERDETRRQLRALNTVPDDPDRVVRLLSGGNQQKVVLARWLLRECRVLLLDEPTRGVDVATKAELYRIICDLAESGIGVLVVSSELEELIGICTRILVMREGEIVAEVDGKTATERELLRHAVAPTDSPDLARRSLHRHRPEPARPRLKQLEFQEYALAIVVVLIFAAGAILEPDTFPTWDNIRNMLTQASVIGVLAMGMTFVIATAGIDLSVGSIVAAAGVFGGVMLGDEGTSTLLFIVMAVGFATLLGIDQRRVCGLRARCAVHRDPGDVLHRQGRRPVPQRQAAGQPAGPQRRRLRRARDLLAALVRQRPDPRDPGIGVRLPRDHRRRLGAAQSDSLRPLRRGRSAATARRRGSPGCRSGGPSSASTC